MPVYMSESKRQGMRATGNVAKSMEWEERDGKRRPSKETQARQVDEATGEVGHPLWEVEVIYSQSSWGRVGTVTATVLVPAKQQPVLGEFVSVVFHGLVVEVRVGKAGGLIESWRADGIAEAEKPARAGTASGSAAA
ncbi:MAG: hypothetical protein ACRCY9_14135 [Phycicoccus sp.]